MLLVSIILIIKRLNSFSYFKTIIAESQLVERLVKVEAAWSCHITAQYHNPEDHDLKL